MSIREWAGRLDRLQRSTQFKVVTSITLALLAVGVVVWYAVAVKADQTAANGAATALDTTNPGSPTPSPESPSGDAVPEGANAAPGAPTPDQMFKLAYGDIVSRQADVTSVGIGAAIGLAICLAIVWLGLGLTYLALGIASALLVWPMIKHGKTLEFFRDELGQAGISFNVRQWGIFLAGIVSLLASFTVLIRVLRLSLGGNGPVFSIARNVVDEAVRLKVSLVFMVMLVFMLASLPGLLDPAVALRYRVQNFLQYGTGGSFWVIAILVLFLAVASVTFEQRDRIIWQTMTKPVAAWQYLLGKWLGVSGIAAALLAVSASGVFLFTEYLRNQRADGERGVAFERNADGTFTDDRILLESQVLAARVFVPFTIEDLPEAQLEEAVQAKVAREKEQDPNFADTEETRSRFRQEAEEHYRDTFFGLRRGQVQTYTFRNLADARASGSPLTLRYKINGGGDNPRFEYGLTFIGARPDVFFENDQQILQVSGGPEDGRLRSAIERTVPPGQTMRLQISPSAVAPDGTLTIQIGNRGLVSGDDESHSISIPPDGLQLYYNAGSYRANYFRVALILWIKLSFLALIGIVFATFLSFPVASLVAFGVFLIAESAGYLAHSLEYYASRTDKGQIIVYKVVIRAIAVPVSEAFQFYARLRPTSNLVDGLLVGWGTVLLTTIVVGVICAALFGIGTLIFKRRELATYSGQ